MNNNFINLEKFSPSTQIKLEALHRDGSKDVILLNHTYNEAQIDWFKAGSALNLIRKENSK